MNEHESPSCVIEARTDIRILASIARFYSLLGHIPSTRSALVRRMINDFYAILLDNGLVEPFETTTEALAYWDSIGLSSPMRSGRATKGLSTALELESLLNKDRSNDSENEKDFTQSDVQAVLRRLMGGNNDD